MAINLLPQINNYLLAQPTDQIHPACSQQAGQRLMTNIVITIISNNSIDPGELRKSTGGKWYQHLLYRLALCPNGRYDNIIKQALLINGGNREIKVTAPNMRKARIKTKIWPGHRIINGKQSPLIQAMHTDIFTWRNRPAAFGTIFYILPSPICKV